MSSMAWLWFVIVLLFIVLVTIVYHAWSRAREVLHTAVAFCVIGGPLLWCVSGKPPPVFRRLLRLRES